MNDVFKQLRDDYEKKVVKKIKEMMNNNKNNKIRAYLCPDAVECYFDTEVKSYGYESDGKCGLNDIIVNGQIWEIYANADYGWVEFNRKQ